jgi:hypothetical protein
MSGSASSSRRSAGRVNPRLQIIQVVSTGLAAHLLRLLQASGASASGTIAKATLLGPAQVAARTRQCREGTGWGSTLKPSKFLMSPLHPRLGPNAARFSPGHSRKDPFSGMLLSLDHGKRRIAGHQKAPAMHHLRESRPR